MSVYGYCRISTAKQSIDRQVRNIRAEYPTVHIVQEAYTGTSILRPEWSKLYRILKEGDTVVFDSVSRMSRNAEEGFSLYEDLYTLLGSLQKELDSFNTSKAIEWLAYDVDYLMGEAYPGETAYVLITEDEYTFSKQGAYKLTYVDTGKTTELVDDQGFRWEASVYFVVDEDTYNENLQKMFRAEQALYDTYERILNNFGLAE